MTGFIKGKKLSGLFYKELIGPLLKQHFPELKYSAGLIGSGSEVIDFDTARSTDHDWGPRILLFVTHQDVSRKSQISSMFSKQLPFRFKGFSTHFEVSKTDKSNLLKKIKTGNINHKIEIYTFESFFKKYLYFKINREITVEDWLVFPEHKLLTLTKGKIFHDDLGLEKTINKFKYYPKDIWLYLLACQWMRISQEEHFMGRCGELDDEIGSRIIASRLVKDIMKMCFLMEKKYSPYIKWFGTAFDELKSSEKLKPILTKVLKSNSWKDREKYLTKAYEFIARKHNTLKITKPLKTATEYFHRRPFLVINGERFAQEIRKKIRNPRIKSLKLNIGSVNQFSDSTDFLEADTQKFKTIYS